MAKSPTIDEVKKAKIEMESSIAKLMQDFESDYGIKLGYIDTKRERKKGSKESAVEAYEPYKGKIKTVEVSMELDALY